MKSHDVLDFFFPFPFVIHEKEIQRTTRLSEKERRDWKKDMVSILVGQYDFKWLTAKLQKEEVKQGKYWKREMLTPFWAPDSSNED